MTSFTRSSRQFGASLLLMFALVLAALAQTPPVDITVTVAPGKTVEFNVTADGTSPFNYAWRKDGVAMTGLNSSKFTLANVTATNSGQYTVAVSNSAGVTVSPRAILQVIPLPVITTQPATLSAIAGTAASFTVAATGAESYQWRKNAANIDSPSAKTATLNLASVTPADAGVYSVVATGPSGSTTSANAALVVIQVTLPSITGWTATVR